MHVFISLNFRVLFAWLPALPLLGVQSELLAQAPAGPTTAADQGKELRTTAGEISRQFRGRWAPTAAACQVDGADTQVVEVSSIGWTSFEEGSRITANGRVRRGTTYYQVRSFAAEERSRPGSLALRLIGSRLAMSETVAGRSVHRDLVRCR
jgi:hypothetical protein